jgi:steroid 5-alpha reductase family enzyme
MIQTLLINFAVTLGAMTLLWLISLVRRDASIVDPFWGLGFVIVAWVSGVMNSPAVPRVALLVALTTLWGLRLSLYLLWRNWDHGEDRRYAAMRAHHGRRF